MAYKYKEYQESDAVKQAKANLDAQLAQKPAAYKSQWQTQLDDALSKIQNREKFAYNVNGDELYKTYKDRYVQQGQQAMQDTMGQAAGLTGGYGSSYSQNAGQQAYHGYLQGLNDVVPELYQIALDRYNQEGENMLNMYGILGDKEAQDYGRWQDAMSAFESERDYLAGLYDAERSYDYGKYSDDRDFAYAKYRDEVSDAQWAKQFAESQRQYNASLAARSAEDSDDDDTKWGKGISTSIGAGQKASPWAMTLHQMTSLIRSGNENGAVAYMDALAAEGRMTEAQYNTLKEMLKEAGLL